MMDLAAWITKVLVIVLLLWFGQWLLDVPVPFDGKEYVLHALGLIAIMIAPDMGNAFYRAFSGK